jgi:hypothetical protein
MQAWLLALFMVMTSLPVFAQSDLTFGKPGYGGPGCPAGTASVAFGGDKQSLRIGFDRYEVSAGGNTRRSFDRKSCNLAIPIKVPAHKSVSVVAILYRGFNRLPPDAKGQVRFGFFVAGEQGPVLTRAFNGPQHGPFSFNEKLTASSTVWSACGTDVNLRTNTSLRVNTVGSSARSSLEVKTALIRFQWRNC